MARASRLIGRGGREHGRPCPPFPGGPSGHGGRAGRGVGAGPHAFGRIRVPLLANDDDLRAAIEAAADAVGEKVWPMPTDPEYRDQINGTIADLKNMGKGREAGVIAAGLFIGHFAGDVPWAHLDISPAAWAESGHDLGPEGATGVMVPTLTRVACV